MAKKDKRFAKPRALRKAEPAEQLTRRNFFSFLARWGMAVAAVAIGYFVMRRYTASEPENITVLAARAGELAPNGWKEFKLGGKPALLILTEGGQYVAMSAVCTHQGCTVRYLPTMREVWCPCHGGFFDLQGQVISGPPPRPLEQYDVNVSGGEILVSRHHSS